MKSNPKEQPMSTESQPVTTADQTTIAAEDLIEEVSIDGMCGVY